MRTWLFGLSVVLMSFSGCEREEVIESADITKLAGIWRLTGPSSPYGITIQIPHLYKDGSKVSGRGPVNSYFAELIDPNLIFTSEERPFHIRNLGSTKIAGESKTQQVEQTYFANLQAVNRYALTNKKQLRLYYGGAQPGILVYERVL